MQFTDSARFMTNSSSHLVNNLSERIYKINYKYRHNDKKFETCGITYEVYDCFLNTQDDLIEHKYLCCNKNCQQKFDEKWKQLFFNTYKFSKHDNNKFLLSLQKGVYPIWMVRESSKKHHYLKMKIFTVT